MNIQYCQSADCVGNKSIAMWKAVWPSCPEEPLYCCHACAVAIADLDKLDELDQRAKWERVLISNSI